MSLIINLKSMSTIHEITKYRLSYFGKRDFELQSIAAINLYNVQDQFIGQILFYKEGQEIPNNQMYGSNLTRVYLRASETQMPGIVDMLRNEKPCSIFYANPTSTSLFTGKEPIGEEETG